MPTGIRPTVPSRPVALGVRPPAPAQVPGFTAVRMPGEVPRSGPSVIPPPPPAPMPGAEGEEHEGIESLLPGNIHNTIINRC